MQNIKTMISIKKNINLWRISYVENSINMSTVFNSGFIDDVEIVKNYFIKNNPHSNNINIIKANE